MSHFFFVNKRFSLGSEKIIDQRKISSSIWKFYPMILELGEQSYETESMCGEHYLQGFLC